MRRTSFTRASIAVVTSAALTVVATPAQGRPAAPPPSAADRAAAAADQALGLAGASTMLRRADGDALKRTGVVAGTRGLHYVTYARTHKGLPVVGGDVVVSTDSAGVVSNTAVAQSAAITTDTVATVSAAAATATAKAKLAKVESVEAAKLVVFALADTPTLTWETKVTGRAADNTPSVLHVFVDAKTGAVVDTVDDVHEGTGNGFYYGNVTINTSGSGSSFALTDTTRPGLACGGQNGAAYTGPDDAWGNGTGTNLETACVDALWGAQREIDMLKTWFNRNGVKGDGTNPPIRVGLADVNAFWNGSYTSFGHSQDNQRQATPIDVVGHELGHAIFQYTPGGAGSGNENGGINEGASDIWGALTEAFANSPLDPPDYEVGETVNLVGQGPIRYMYDPSKAGDPNCYSSSIPSTEVHAAAGPINHWFYLTAEGSAPAGKPASPTCNSSSVTGIGIKKAGEIFYNAELLKTSSWKYVNVRVASLTAAKNLYPGSCTEFNTVKAAWAAVSVPAQAGEPTCTIGTPGNDFSISASPASGSVAPGGTAGTTIATATTSGAAQTVALTASGLPAGTTATFVPASVSSGSSSTLTLATSASTPAGTYTVTVTGTGGVTHSTAYTLTVTGTGGGSCTGTNGTDLPIPASGTTVNSSIVISGCGHAPSTASKVEVHVIHPYRGDVVVSLIAPDGTSYPLKASSSSDSADNIDATYTVNLGSEAANGTWKLALRDVFVLDTGRLDSWTLTL